MLKYLTTPQDRSQPPTVKTGQGRARNVLSRSPPWVWFRYNEAGPLALEGQEPHLLAGCENYKGK